LNIDIYRIGLSIVAFQRYFHLYQNRLQLLIIPEELKCGVDYERKRGAMGIEWGFGLLIIDPEAPLRNAYFSCSNRNWSLIE
jgi:hypothetical protein